jgi:hypothetical protein
MAAVGVVTCVLRGSCADAVGFLVSLVPPHTAEVISCLASLFSLRYVLMHLGSAATDYMDISEYY